MSTLRVLLLGTPTIERNETSVTVDTRKAIALLAYLAATTGAHTRETLSTLLYPDYDEVRGRAALRRTLSALSKAIGAEWLQTDRLSISLVADDALFVDLHRFQALMERYRRHEHAATAACTECRAWLMEAVDLYRDDFMAGFSLRDSDRFDEWQFFQTESLRQELAFALDRLTEQQIAGAQYDAAIPYARRWLGLDSLHEPAHRRLMLLFAWTNQWSAALRQYEECRRILADELGVEPLPETTALYEEIRKNRSPQPASPIPPASTALAPPPSAFAFPMVGRSAELQDLIQAYERLQNHGGLTVIQGEAGIGKTRLMEEFLSFARALGAEATGATCYEGEMNLAFGPFIAALRLGLSQSQNDEMVAALPAHTLGEAARLLPELSNLRPDLSAPSPLSSPGTQTRFFAAIRHMIYALLAGKRPGILYFDDVQWADDASLELLAYLVRRLPDDPPLCICINGREEGLETDHLLFTILKDARRAGSLHSLSLTRLPPEAVASLVSGIIGAETDPTWGARLYDETEGIPFFVVEYLKGLDQASANQTRPWQLPSGVRDLLHARLAAVSDIARQVLATAAVIGRSSDFDTVRAASGRSDEETIQALEELVLRGLIVESDDGSTPHYDFCHEKLRTLVYDEASLARRRLLHLRVAQALSSRPRTQPGSDTPPGQIAYHFQRGGDLTNASHYFAIAGDQARDLYANAEALNDYRSALALGHPQASHLQEAIADLLTLRGDYGDALRAYEMASAAADKPGLARLEQKLGDVYQRRGDWQLAERHYVAALALLGEDAEPARVARLLAERSLTAHNCGLPEQAQTLAAQALALAQSVGDEQALARTYNILGVLAYHRADLPAARQNLKQSLTLALRQNDPTAQMAALNNLALVQAEGGDPKAALSLAEEALALCATLGDRHREAALHNQIADLSHALGREDVAMTHLKLAVQIFADIGEDGESMQPEIWKLVSW